MSILELNNFTITYSGKKQPVFAPLNLSMQQGESIALRGASGAGKSSLLLSICGLIPHSIPAETTGKLRLLGRQPSEFTQAERANAIGMVFQNPETQLFCGTVELEVAFGLENLCVPHDEMHARVKDALEQVGLWARRKEPPSVLSGGQKQLLALACVLAMKPRLLLLDEALSQLDEQAQQRLMEVLCKLQKNGQSIFFVDHDDVRCSALASREVWL